MNVKCVIKLIGDEAKGVSSRTGNEWKARHILLEWTDGEDVNRVWATMFNQVVEAFERGNFALGSECVASLTFSGHSFRTGYNKTEVNVKDIRYATSLDNNF